MIDIQKYLPYILGAVVLLVILYRINFLGLMRDEEEEEPEAPRDMLNEAMEHDLKYLHDIGFQQS